MKRGLGCIEFKTASGLTESPSTLLSGKNLTNNSLFLSSQKIYFTLPADKNVLLKIDIFMPGRKEWQQGGTHRPLSGDNL
jgi:hypothetical protein